MRTCDICGANETDRDTKVAQFTAKVEDIEHESAKDLEWKYGHATYAYIEVCSGCCYAMWEARTCDPRYHKDALKNRLLKKWGIVQEATVEKEVKKSEEVADTHDGSSAA